MNISSKKDLENIIQYERKMWIARMYPQGAPSKVRSITLLYMKALRKYVQDNWPNNECIDSPVCIW